MSKTKINIIDLRSHYNLEQLSEKTLSKNPFTQFETWMNSALEKNLKEPNAMHLSTVNKENKPAARIVLLRGFNKKGSIFYTHYLSQTGMELTSNPYAAP